MVLVEIHFWFFFVWSFVYGNVSGMVGNEHAGFNEAVLLRMLVRELTMHKETINQ